MVGPSSTPPSNESSIEPQKERKGNPPPQPNPIFFLPRLRLRAGSPPEEEFSSRRRPPPPLCWTGDPSHLGLLGLISSFVVSGRSDEILGIEHMTCRMAAGQQKKRLSNSSLPDQHRSKKKPKFDSPDSLLVNLKSHIHLEWDEHSKRVIPSKEQIGISWSHLAPFIDSSSPSNKRPHVTRVPRDIFALENLNGVLSYEVWATCLTEAERNFLTQFLPAGTNAEEILHLLRTGKNHHFGNPFISWFSSLCYGDLHPDAILNKEQQIRDDEKTYRAELNNYHSNMIDILKKWKEKWLTCDNLETLFRDNPAKQKQADLQSPGEKIIFSNAPKKEMPMKVLRNCDVSKFMSYIKISRSQHDLVKRMKQSGDGIQMKHLTPVIGDIDNFHVKPYETLVEDEKKRLHNHWAILSCKDLPAAVETRRDRKLMIENLRTSLCLELAEKNTSVVEKAEQVADRTADVGQDGAYQNGDLPDGQEELVEHSPQGMLQAGNDGSAVLEDEDVKDTSDTDASFRSHDSPNMKDQDVMDMNNTNITTQSQNSSDEQDQDLKHIGCTNTSTDSGNSSSKKDEDLEDISYRNGISQSSSSPGVEDEDMKDTSYKDTTLQDHNIPDTQSQKPSAISYATTPIQGLNSPYMLVQDLKNNSYTGLSIDGHAVSDEQNDDLENISYLRASTGHDMNDIPSSNSNQGMDHMVVDQKEAESIAMIPSDSTLLFLKPSSQEKNVEEGPELQEPAAKCEKELWQSASPVESFYRPPENSLYTQSGDLQLKHHLSGRQATSMIDLGRDARSRQQAEVTIAAALPMGSAASLLQPCTNQQNNQQLQIRAGGIGMAPSYSLGHVNGIKQSIDLHSMANDRLDQSALVCSPLQVQMQLLDQSNNGLYLQQLPKNLYSGAGLCTQETIPIVEQQNFSGHAAVDRSCNWFPDELPPHNNWPGMESDGIAAQDLPEGSSADGSLLSVLSQYRQASSRVQLGASRTDQSLETRDLVPPHAAQDVHVSRAENIVPPGPNMYGYTTQNMASNPPSSDVDASANNLQWANLAQESHGMPDHCFRQFGGPWSR